MDNNLIGDNCKSKKEKNEINELRDERDFFMQTIMHNLKTPVRSAIRLIELLIKGSFGELNDAQKEVLKEVLNSSTQMMFMLDSIILKKIHSLEENNNELLLKLLEEVSENEVLVVDLEKVVVSSNKKFANKKLTLDLKKVLEKRQKKLDIGLQIVLDEHIDCNICIYPIIKNSNLYGAIVILLQKTIITKKSNEIIELIVKLYTESCF